MMFNSKYFISITLSIAIILGSYPQFSNAIDRADAQPIKVSQQANKSSRLREFQEKVAKLEQELSEYRAKGDRKKEFYTLKRLGTEHDKVAQHQKAIEYYDRSLLISKENGKYAESMTLGILGSMYNYLGQYQKAIEQYERSLLAMKRDAHGFPRIFSSGFEVITLSDLGNAHQSIGQYQKAVEYHTQALLISKETNRKEFELRSSIDLGNAHQSMGKHQKAIEYFTQALSVAREIDASQKSKEERIILNNLGVVYSSLGQYPKAIEYFSKALAIENNSSTTDEGSISTNLAHVSYKLKKIADAEKFSIRSLKYSTDRDLDSLSIYRPSQILTIANPYQLRQKILVEQGKAPEALEIVERDRANQISKLLASKIYMMDNESQAKFRQAPDIARIKAIAKQKNTTLVRYSIVENTIYTWVISPEGKISFKQTQLPANTKIRDLIVAARDSIGASRVQWNPNQPNTNLTKFNDPLKQLYQLFIAPIAAELPQDPNALITFVPQDELLFVPFNILQNPQGKYLIEQHTLTVSPSIQMLGLTMNNAQKKGTPLIVGNPIMPPYQGEKLSPLPGTEREAKQIGKILKVSPLIGAAADKQEVVKRMPMANFIHVASHGLSIRVAGELPGAVALTNGYLTSDEIFDLQLQADLVVFPIEGGGENELTVSALTPLIAGASSVVLPTWEISDETTVVLMTEFYRQLQVKKLPKAQAMRQAMLKTKKEFEQPNFWGAFILVGEGR